MSNKRFDLFGLCSMLLGDFLLRICEQSQLAASFNNIDVALNCLNKVALDISWNQPPPFPYESLDGLTCKSLMIEVSFTTSGQISSIPFLCEMFYAYTIHIVFVVATSMVADAQHSTMCFHL